MIRALYLLYATAALISFASADWQFRTRPDLSPPQLNITVPANGASVEKGYLILAPYPGFGQGFHGPEQPGAYILRDDGELVWSGVGYFGGWVANFAVDEFKGRPVLRAFQGLLDSSHGRMYGDHVILSNKYRTIKTVRAGAHRLVSAHEFRIVGGKSVLIETPVAKPVDLKPWGADKGQDWIVSGGFQELDIESGKVLFEWYSFDHVDPRYGVFPLNSGDEHVGTGRNTSDAWNYFHINSVDKDDEGNYLISARNYAAIFKINGTTGEVIWQLGGLHHRSTFKVPREVRFAYQHDARFLSRSSDGTLETISFFDNSAHSTAVRINPFSRARIVQLNHTAKIATALATYPAPDNLSAPSQGSARVLPNGNVFVNWGQAGAVTEFAPDGDVLFHAYLDSDPVGRGVQSYRAFRSNWTGYSSEEPAILAEASEDGTRVTVYVSWNGDTETATWKLYGGYLATGPEKTVRRFLGASQRTGFETSITFAAPATLDDFVVLAVAVDATGTVLTHSKPVEVLLTGVEVLPAKTWDSELGDERKQIIFGDRASLGTRNEQNAA